MRFSRSIAPLLGLAALAALGPAAAPVHAQSYTLTILNPAGLGNTAAFGVNNTGQVTGYSHTDSGHSLVFLSGANGGTVKGLGTLPGDNSSSGGAVNDAGQVAGYSYNSNGSPSHAFLSGANGGPLQDLGTLPGDSSSNGYAVNASGQVAGESDNADGTAHAFLSDVNGGTLNNLGNLGGTLRNSSASAVNNTGQVAGFSFNDDFTVIHAFLSGANGGALQDLGSLGGGLTNSLAEGVNNAGQVVGSCFSSDFSADAAFVFSGGTMKDLNSLIVPGSSFYLDNASGISDTGFITGLGSDGNGNQYGFLLTPINAPVPEASTTVSLGLLLALGMGGMVVAARRKKPAA